MRHQAEKFLEGRRLTFTRYETELRRQGIEVMPSLKLHPLNLTVLQEIYIGGGAYGDVYWVKCEQLKPNGEPYVFSAVIKKYRKETDLISLQEKHYVLRQLQKELGINVLPSYYISADENGQGYFVLMTYGDRQGQTVLGRAEEGTTAVTRLGEYITKVDLKIFEQFVEVVMSGQSRAAHRFIDLPFDTFFSGVDANTPISGIRPIAGDFDTVKTFVQDLQERLREDNQISGCQYLRKLVEDSFEYDLREDLHAIVDKHCGTIGNVR